MRIFYFSGTKLPSQSAQSVHAMKMAQAFSTAGHDVTLFAKGVAEAQEAEIFEAYGTEPTFRLELSTFSSIPLISGAARWMDTSARARKLPEPDLIYGADPSTLLAMVRGNAKIMLESHSLPEHTSQHWALLKLIKHPNFRGIIAACDLLKQEFLKKYPMLDDQKIYVAYDGAELIGRQKSTPRTAVSLRGRKGALNIGYVGSLHAGKGIDVICELAELRRDYEFHIVGGTEKHIQKYTSNVYSWNLHFYGHRNHAEIPSYLDTFDIVLAPYQHNALVNTDHNTSRWLSPIKIFEYMAAAKPMLCSNLPILREILQHEHNALLLRPGDTQEWANALDQLKHKPVLAANIALNAYNDLAGKFTWEKRAEAILRFAADKPDVFRLAQVS